MCFATDAKAVGCIITTDATRCIKSFTILTKVELTVKLKAALSLVYQMIMSRHFYRLTVIYWAIGIFVFIVLFSLYKWFDILLS